MDKNLLYKLPKDILVDLIIKSYDFEKLSLEEVEKIHSSIHTKSMQKYLQELDKVRHLMCKTHNFGYVFSRMDIVNFSEIRVSDSFSMKELFRINLYYGHRYNYGFGSGNGKYTQYETEEELLNKCSSFLRDNKYNEEIISPLVTQMRIYIEAFYEKTDIQKILSKYKYYN